MSLESVNQPTITKITNNTKITIKYYYMKNMKDRIRAMGGTFKTNRFDPNKEYIPYFKNQKHCGGKLDPSLCGSPQTHQRLLDQTGWYSNCWKCKRKWTTLDNK